MVVGENTQIVSLQDTVVDEPKILCIIRDMLDASSASVKHTINLSASMSVRGFVNEVAKQFGYMYGTIAVHYERQEGAEIAEMGCENYMESYLGDIVVPNVRRHNFTICELDGKLPKKIPPPPPALPASGEYARCIVSDSSSSSGLDSSNYFSSNNTVEPRPSISSTASASSSYTSEYTYASTLVKSDTGYVGLVNQAMTCYLNSLLQTLFMTPEFRNAIYRFHFDRDKGVKNIPYQLQRLFLLLQTSKKRAVETSDLTKSFGWDSSEVWQQHDVQELCRVMFDALEVTWRNTDQENLINHLYQGKMKDYVKCLECSYESAREDTFLDIPLVIRPFGSNTAYKSIEEALKAFVAPEILEGRDQYFCEKCNKKCDAHKGLKFMSFPYMLTLQMKRFDFDYNLMHRIKLNHRMTFPEILNLNRLLEDQTEDVENGEDTVIPEDTNVDDTSNDNAIDEGIEVEGSATSGTDESGLFNEALVNDKNAQASDVKGPYVYELFSIMIHSGSAAGGHYYAYIKCLSDGQWYSFNDQHVTKITYDDIRKTYGGNTTTRGYYSSTYASSANAYMLMYRQIDKERNADFIMPEDFPEHVKEELRRLNDKEEADRKQKELDKSTCKIKVFCNHPTTNKRMDHKLEIHKDKTWGDAIDMARKIFEIEELVEHDCCRFVKYDEYQDTLEYSFDEEKETAVEKVLGGVKQSYSFDLLLETRKPEQKFQPYKPGGVTVRVYLVDLEKELIVEPPSTVRAYLVQTVTEFKELVSQMLDIPDKQMGCVLERFHNDLKVLDVPEKTLKSEGFFKTNKVYVEVTGSVSGNVASTFTGPMTEDMFKETKFFHLVDRHQNTLRVMINLPTLTEVEEFKKGMFIREPSPGGHDSAVESGVNSAENSTDNSVDMCNHKLNRLDIDEGMSAERANLLQDIKNLNIQSQLSRSDPNLYQNRTSDGVITQGDVIDSLKNRGSRTSLECQDSRSCSQSTQSTSTSAEFSLSHICDGTSESPDEGLVVSPGDKTSYPLMTPGDKGPVTVGPGGEPADHNCVDLELVDKSETDVSKSYTVASGELSDVLKKDKGVFVPETDGLEENKSSVVFEDKVGADSSEDNSLSNSEDNSTSFFQGELTKSDDPDQRTVAASVDKRINLGAFKSAVEPFVGIPASHFKVYRVYSNNQEFESIRLNETLSFLEDGRIKIKLGRALRTGEYRVKVYQLVVNDAEPSKLLIDTIFARGMTVLESKKQILPELKLQLGMDIPLDRCRMRKKTWKNPGTIYVDNQMYEDEIPIYPNWEVFMEVLQGPEVLLSTAQLAIYVRRWWPSKYELGPFHEVVISDQTVDELKHKVSELSGINVDDIEIAKGRGTFPFDVSLLEIHTDLDWNPSVTSLGMWPLYICDDGCLVYYRDKNEELLEMDEERKKELENKENARLSKVSQRVTYSPRKEKALKIYTEEPSPVTTNSTNISPDLD